MARDEVDDPALPAIREPEKEFLAQDNIPIGLIFLFVPEQIRECVVDGRVFEDTFFGLDKVDAEEVRTHFKLKALTVSEVEGTGKFPPDQSVMSWASLTWGSESAIASTPSARRMSGTSSARATRVRAQ